MGTNHPARTFGSIVTIFQMECEPSVIPMVEDSDTVKRKLLPRLTAMGESVDWLNFEDAFGSMHVFSTNIITKIKVENSALVDLSYGDDDEDDDDDGGGASVPARPKMPRPDDLVGAFVFSVGG